MDFFHRTNCISPVKLSSKSKFNFKCHPDIKCFTDCCRDINITLTPYDIIQLKTRLGLSSRDFLRIYTNPQLLEKTDLPMVTLKLLDDEMKSCPFVKKNKGCIIYNHRPISCRYYPIGLATLQYEENEEDKNFFFFVNEDHCKGFEQEKEWSVNNWRNDQGLDIRDKINFEWTDIIVRKRSFPVNIKLTEKAKQIFFLVSYDIDNFRDFVFKTSFFNRFQVSKNIKKLIIKNELELLKFGLKWLKELLFDKSKTNDNFKMN